MKKIRKTHNPLTPEQIEKICQASKEWANQVSAANLPAEQMCLRALDEEDGSWEED